LTALGGLTALGLGEGETVRWRSVPGGRWATGRAAGRERDGSVAVVDSRGAARSLSVDRLEVQCHGPRGRQGWEPLPDRVARTEQLRLL
jgi:hypothetical protein